MDAGFDPADYDRAAAARILAEVLPLADLAAGQQLPAPARVVARLTPLVTASGSHLTAAQDDHLRTDLPGCPPELVTSATHRVLWNDSGGAVNVAHCGPSGLGPLVPVVARETSLVLWRLLAGDDQVRAAAENLPASAWATMAATTTDRDPREIFRVGLETTSRALVQHAYLADRTPYRTPAGFAGEMRDSGLFAVVANTWFWGLQSSTYRRGMIPVRLTTGADGTIRYDRETAAVLRTMKTEAMTEARTVTAGPLARQYALLPAGELPRCLANMPTTAGVLLPAVVEAFVETFVRLLELVTVTGDPQPQKEARMGSTDVVFEDPGHDLLALHQHHHQRAANPRRHGLADRPRHQDGGRRVPDSRGAGSLLRRDSRRGLHRRAAGRLPTQLVAAAGQVGGLGGVAGQLDGSVVGRA